MLKARNLQRLFAVVSLMVSAGTACGQQDYPTRPIRIVASAAGGGVDFAARLIAQGLTGNLGQQVIVDNRAAGIPGEIVPKAPADGYTLLVIGSTLWLAQYLQENVSYDVMRDFSPIMLATSSPLVLVAHASVPAGSIKELIALAKARPGALNYAAAGAGSPNHIAAELFKAMAGLDIVSIPYKGSGPALNDLIGGQVQLAFFPSAAAVPHIKSGRLKALAVTSLEPTALAPGLPPLAATVAGYEAVSITGVFAPARTPAPIVNRVNQEIARVLNQPDTKEKFFNAGVEVVGSSPAQFAAKLKSEMARWGKVIKDAGIREQ